MRLSIYSISLLLTLCLTISAGAETELPMSVISRNSIAYTNFLKEKNKSVLGIDNLESRYSNRNIASIVIIMQALSAGGYPAKLKFVEAANYAREVKMTKQGKTVIMHQDAWDRSFDDRVYKSSEIISKGKFVKGIYVAEADKKMYQVKSIDDLRYFSSVSNSSWKVDWKTLEKIGLKKLVSTSKKEFMFNQVLFRNIDFTIQEFTNSDDLAYELSNGRLVPVPGIKLSLDGSRHLMVSKTHKNGLEVYIALEKGLKILKEKGTIDRFLEEAGFYRPEIYDWQTLSVE